MFLKRLILTNFRNYPFLKFNFENQITILIGDNAQGKSNFLEAIYFLATAKSPRADKDQELIRKGQNYLIVEGEVTTQDQTYTKEDKTDLAIAMQAQNGRMSKRVKVNGIGRKIADYVTSLKVVLFAPDDVNLVAGAPSLRRAHLDQLLSQVDKEYKKALTSYEKVIVRKNKILKAINEDQASTEELIFWSDQQLILGTIIALKREHFFNYLNSIEKKFGQFQFAFQPSQISAQRLKEYQSREIAASSSLLGPHRDDFTFKLNGSDLARFGSRGEQRTAVLDLKLAEVSFMEKVLGHRPLFLLDDIFSELDDTHRQHVIELAKLQQTVIATVEFDQYLQKSLAKSKWLKVHHGFFKNFAH